MAPSHPPAGDPLATGGETRVATEVFIEAFVDRCRRGEQPRIEEHLPPEGQPHRRDVLISLIEADLKQRAAAGEAVRLEDYLTRFRELGTADQVSVDLIAAEFAALSSANFAPSIDSYAARFPHQIDELRRRLSLAKSADKPRRAEIDLPPGTIVDDFEIVRLLGAGSLARVYLARQISLDRMVALKVSARPDDEARTLARLDHDHVVPVFSEHDDGHGRRLLAMRFIPGITAAAWLERVSSEGRLPTSGARLLSMIDDAAASDLPTPETAERRAMANATYVEAVCRMVLGLARALQHAHRRGVLHRDIKPANVLLAQSGRAMLMDFNVSVRSATEEDQPARIGGTLAYMAPEHLARFAPEMQTSPDPVDERSDIYSLGIVFYELLSGASPFAEQQQKSGSLAASVNRMLAERTRGPRPWPPEVRLPPSLRAMVSRCLAPRLEDRYQSAAELSEDLDHFLSHKPLRHAPDRSHGERVKKWGRRHPRIVSALAATAAMLVLAIVGLGVSESRRLAQAAQLMDAADAKLTARRPADAGRLVAQAEGLLSVPRYVTTMLGGPASQTSATHRLDSLSRQVADQQYELFRNMVQRLRAEGATAPDGDETTDDLLSVYGVMSGSDWRSQPAYRRLDPQKQHDVDEDVAELLLVRAIDLINKPVDKRDLPLRARAVMTMLKRVPPEHRHRAALKIVEKHLHEALKAIPSAFQTAEDRASSSPKDDSLSSKRVPQENHRSEFDEYLLGVLAAKQGDFAKAIDHLEVCLDARRQKGRKPRYWAQFLLAWCLDQSDRDDEAVAAYGVCAGMQPEFAWPYHNMGLIYAKQNKLDAAEDCFCDAMERNPKLASAYANLGVVRYRKKEYGAAIESLSRAIQLGATTAEVFSNRAAARSAEGDRDGALQDLKRALEVDPNNEVARRNLKRLQSMSQDR